jgi:hypothetical protein
MHAMKPLLFVWAKRHSDLNLMMGFDLAETLISSRPLSSDRLWQEKKIVSEKRRSLESGSRLDMSPRKIA